MKKQIFIAVLFLLPFAPHIYSQISIVEGIVSDTNGEVAIGASVVNKNKKIGTITDLDGHYTIKSEKGDTLVFSYLGYITQKEVVTSALCNALLAEDKSYDMNLYPYHRRRQPPTVDLTAIPVEYLQVENGRLQEKMTCISVANLLQNQNSNKLEDNSSKEEYEAIVMEPGYETFLATQKPKEFYSLSSLRTKNTFLVNEWNIRCKNPSRYNPSIYEMEIDYNTLTDYGIDVEYKLYMFFRYMNKKYGLGLEVGNV